VSPQRTLTFAVAKMEIKFLCQQVINQYTQTQKMKKNCKVKKKRSIMEESKGSMLFAGESATEIDELTSYLFFFFLLPNNYIIILMNYNLTDIVTTMQPIYRIRVYLQKAILPSAEQCTKK
jgi:hypothetical protein